MHNSMSLFATLQYVIIVTSVYLISVTSPCGPGRGYGQRRAAKKMTPLVFKQHVPNVAEHALGASGPSEGRISWSTTEPSPSPPTRTPVHSVGQRRARKAEHGHGGGGRSGYRSAAAATQGQAAPSKLVINQNKEIVFKDEEEDGSDRIMSQRCRDKLNALAILTMTHWPGIRLRVTNAWADAEADHGMGGLGQPVDSLHFEGRAVDITTSDRDRTKYGMLARLAVHAGFDWVYYEARGHIHCSVKTDSTAAVATGCFSGDSTVRVLQTNADTEFTSYETIPMSNLKIGDRVLALDDVTKQLKYDVVVSFLHRSATLRPLMYTLETETGRRINLTPSHLIYTKHRRHFSENISNGTDALFTDSRRIFDDDTRAEFAHRVTRGRYIYVLDDDVVTLDRVTSVSAHFSASGAYAPITATGTIVVDDVIASCYALVDSHALAHAAMTPLRFMYYVIEAMTSQTFDSSWSSTYEDDRLHWYGGLLHTIGRYVLPSDMWFV